MSKKRRVYFHIGTFKTGTSSIQNYLADNAQRLQEHGFFVPGGELRNHYVLPLSLIIDHTDFRSTWPEIPRRSDYYWNLLKHQITSTRCTNIIISAEAFCDFVHPSVKHKNELFKKILQDTFAEFEVKVVIYLRKIADYIGSMYRESVKLGGINSSFPEFLHRELRQNSFHTNPLLIIEYYKSVFGDDSIVAREYGKANMVNGNVIDDFFCTIECDLPVRKSSAYRANASLTPASAAVKRIFNELQFVDVEFNRFISELLIESVNQSQNVEISQAAQDILNANAQTLFDNLGIDIRQDLVNTKFDSPVAEDTTFIILLLSLLVKQNRRLLADVDEIKSRLNSLGINLS